MAEFKASCDISWPLATLSYLRPVICGVGKFNDNDFLFFFFFPLLLWPLLMSSCFLSTEEYLEYIAGGEMIVQSVWAFLCSFIVQMPPKGFVTLH
jgi:hypothetical protein